MCSTWNSFHSEISFLHNFFHNNFYPNNAFTDCVRNFLNNVYNPITPVPEVPKKEHFVSFPYIGPESCHLKREILKLMDTFFPHIRIKPIFVNPLRMSSFFKFKDSLPNSMRSNVVYMFNCPQCNCGSYIGSTERLLKVRVDAHRGVSHRTGSELNHKENSTIRNHCFKCKYRMKYKDFEIAIQANNKTDLLILESLLIKQKCPSLNSDSTSTPLHIA